MASANCWRCLSRPSQRLFPAPSLVSTTSPILSRAPFTTSAALSLKASSGKTIKRSGADSGRSRHQRIGKMLKLSDTKYKQRKKGRTGRPVEPGERKAFRKRIQLSNDNALKVEGLMELTADIIKSPAAIGQVVSLSNGMIDNLRACEAFKSSQNWGLFRSPHFLIRRETVELANLMHEAVSKKETLRLVIRGSRASGKSVLGLQALSAGLLNDYVVINVPEAYDVTTARTEYSPISRTEMFSQPAYAGKIVQAMLTNNARILSKYKVELPSNYAAPGTTLSQVLQNAKEGDSSWNALNTIWRELQQPGRPPVVFVLDGLSYIMRVSEYMSPSFQPIHSHDLALVRMFVDALGGKAKLPNGGAIIGVDTKGNRLNIPSMELALDQAEAAQNGAPIPPRDPYFRHYDERVFESLKGVRTMNLRGVGKPEARSLLEYWAASGILRQRVDEYNVADKMAMSGGLVGEMERVTLYDSRMHTSFTFA